MYKNFKISPEEKKQILEMHINNGYKKPINETYGLPWLTKIKINSPNQLSQKDKISLTKKIQRYFPGIIAVEFDPNEWYADDKYIQNPKIDNIDEFENYVDEKYYKDFKEYKKRAKPEIETYNRNTPLDQPHAFQYKSFDDFLSNEY